MRISVAVITYNWPEALELVLKALAAQSELPHEVIVTDDGSQPATRELLKRVALDYPVRLVHLWQPDDGARMSRARNRAIAAAQGDYIILLDGDMVAERHFIADHRANDTFTLANRLMKAGVEAYWLKEPASAAADFGPGALYVPNRGQARANNVGWRIDYQVVSPSLRERLKACSIYRDERFSDHAPYTVDYAD